MPVLLVIPARYGSTRYPGKPLVPIRGAQGTAKSLVRRTWEAAKAARGIDRIVIATDDPRIVEHAAAFGAETLMTPEACRNGTERCAAAAEALPDYDLVVNLQGDAPLTPPWFIETLVSAAREDAGAALTTPVLRCDRRTLEALLSDRKAGRVGGTTAVCDAGGRALYFSKEVIPFTGRMGEETELPAVLHHVGVYAYRRDPLLRYSTLQEGALERAEGLEQLRFLENGLAVRCVEVEARGRSFWELNNPEDLPVIERALGELGLP